MNTFLALYIMWFFTSMFFAFLPLILLFCYYIICAVYFIPAWFQKNEQDVFDAITHETIAVIDFYIETRYAEKCFIWPILLIRALYQCLTSLRDGIL